MARHHSRSRSSRGKKASRSKKTASKSRSRRSHRSSSSGGLGHVLKLAERDYFIKTLGGFLDQNNEAITNPDSFTNTPGIGWAKNGKFGDEYFWDSFSLPELQNNLVQFTAQSMQLKKLSSAMLVYAANVEKAQKALQAEVVRKYKTQQKLSEQIQQDIPKGILPVQTLWQFQRDEQKKNLNKNITSQIAAYQEFQRMMGLTPRTTTPSTEPARAARTE